jgi:hypothetical protein
VCEQISKTDDVVLLSMLSNRLSIWISLKPAKCTIFLNWNKNVVIKFSAHGLTTQSLEIDCLQTSMVLLEIYIIEIYIIEIYSSYNNAF